MRIKKFFQNFPPKKQKREASFTISHPHVAEDLSEIKVLSNFRSAMQECQPGFQGHLTGEVGQQRHALEVSCCQYNVDQSLPSALHMAIVKPEVSKHGRAVHQCWLMQTLPYCPASTLRMHFLRHPSFIQLSVAFCCFLSLLFQLTSFFQFFHVCLSNLFPLFTFTAIAIGLNPPTQFGFPMALITSFISLQSILVLLPYLSILLIAFLMSLHNQKRGFLLPVKF